MTRIDLSLDDTRRLTAAVAEHGSVDALLEAAAKRRANAKPTLSARDVLDAYNLKLLSRDEARRLLGIRSARRRTTA